MAYNNIYHFIVSVVGIGVQLTWDSWFWTSHNYGERPSSFA